MFIASAIGNRTLLRIAFLAALVAGVFSFWSCAPTVRLPSEPLPAAAPGELFSRAENRYEKKMYPDALHFYREYLARFPDGAFADAALLKIGKILLEQGDFPRAWEAFRKLIDSHPQSPFVPEAEYDLLVVLYREGRHEELLRRGKADLEKPLSASRFIRTCLLLADTHLVVGAPGEALRYDLLAYAKSDRFERERIFPRIRIAADGLAAAEIGDLIGEMEDPASGGDLLLELGKAYLEAGDHEKGFWLLAVLKEGFPDHPSGDQARQMVEKLRAERDFERHKIGCLLPLSGSHEAYGQKALRGIELALNLFGQENPGRDIAIVIKDSGSDPEKIALAVRELAEQKPSAVIGPMVAAEQAVQEAQNLEIPIIILTQKENITQTGDYVFRHFIMPRMQVRALVSHAAGRLGAGRFAVLYPDESYGKAFMSLFAEEVRAAGGQLVATESYGVSATDFAKPIKRLAAVYRKSPKGLSPNLPVAAVSGDTAAGGPATAYADTGSPPSLRAGFDALFIPDAPRKIGLILPQLAYYDLKGVHLLGTNLWHSPSLLEMAGQFVQGAIVADGFFAESPSGPVKEFVRAFQEVYGEMPGFIEAIAYDTARMVLSILARPETRSKENVRDALMKLRDFPGVTGPTSFEESGEPLKKLFLLQVRGKGFVEVDPGSPTG